MATTILAPPRSNPASSIRPRMAAPRKPPLALRRRFGECCIRLAEALRVEKEAGRNQLFRSIRGIRVGSTMKSPMAVKRVCQRIEAALANVQPGAV